MDFSHKTDPLNKLTRKKVTLWSQLLARMDRHCKQAETMTFFAKKIFFIDLSVMKICFQQSYWSTRSADPQSRPVVITVFTQCCLSRDYFSKYHKTKHFSSENRDRYWRDWGSGRVDHWLHLSYKTTCQVTWLSNSLEGWRKIVLQYWVTPSSWHDVILERYLEQVTTFFMFFFVF